VNHRHLHVWHNFATVYLYAYAVFVWAECANRILIVLVDVIIVVNVIALDAIVDRNFFFNIYGCALFILKLILFVIMHASFVSVIGIFIKC
jgi:hypothetical protein